MSIDRGEDQAAIIMGVQFDDDLCAITYVEPRDVGEGAAKQSTVMIDPDQVEDQLEIVKDAIRELLDEGLLLIRKPASKLSRVGALARADREGRSDDED